ncbi:MAG: hypothetical protein COT92_01830 [Candidatus Doudnabacteria bacterium CG10_big_fil_rev_8_21_14_0_10_42_18]|uniref:Uncharacterized protein n=1 Tax=Candidatus Doudnabacteria bacterium CG10_big_fil_rev_8_21_14_0_10_42_18 TaxID=1974552 RepID=A0A2H0VB24_9BACT|nr:MAG: hypothetical protein COT92_01830 [Candidatus Doudnabacteria bacterium CG10_big_fil_rev_8_21_14_0_10_42_18]
MINCVKLVFIGTIFSALALTPVLSSAQNFESIDFFYGIGCPHCAEVEPVIDRFISDYPQVTLNKHEVYQNWDNAVVLNQKFEQFDIPYTQRGVPALFSGTESAIGDRPIIDYLEKLSSRLAAEETPTQKEETTPGEQEEMVPISNDGNHQNPPANTENRQNKTPKTYKNSLSIAAIAGAALVDSINPCAIAVLLILLGALMLSSENKKRALLGGLAFTLAVYIGYFLFGLGLISAFHFSGLAGWLYKIIGALAILIGLANLKDYFAYGAGGFVMEIPRSWRPKLKSFLNKVTSPWGAFLAGFVVLFFELPCTGGPYFFVIGLLSQTDRLTNVIPTLLFYNLVFVLPLLIITGLIYWGKSSVEKANEWKDKNIRLLHLIGGIIMLALGIWIIFWG